MIDLVIDLLIDVTGDHSHSSLENCPCINITITGAFDTYCKPLKRMYNVHVYCPEFSGLYNLHSWYRNTVQHTLFSLSFSGENSAFVHSGAAVASHYNVAFSFHQLPITHSVLFI